MTDVAQTSNERAWLIEWPVSDNLPARWWHPQTGWMIDANKAARFSRQQDAEAFIKAGCFCRPIVATEHGWIAPAHETCAVDTRTSDEKFEELKAQCQSLWRTDITLVCRLPKGHSGDHRASNNWTWNGNGVDVRAAQKANSVGPQCNCQGEECHGIAAASAHGDICRKEQW